MSAWPWSTTLRLMVCGGLVAVCARHAAAQVAQTGPPSKSITSSIKDGFDKLTGAGGPPKKPAETEPPNDAVSLKNNPRPSVGVYTAVARLYEQKGRLAEAEQNYQLALKEKPQDLAALLGYAHLKEQLGKADDAVKLYQQAANAHPREAAVFNNLGLCYARHDKLEEGAVALGRAVSLQPRNTLYRNNIATVLVDLGRTQEAFSHLRAVHGEAAAHYNLGYLLNKKGMKQEAAQHFAAALRLDPSLSQAKSWLDRLQGPPAPPAAAAQSRVPAGQPSAPILTSSRPAPPQAGPDSSVNGGPRPDAKRLPAKPRAEGLDASRRGSPPSDSPPMPPELSMPVRLPPTELLEPPGPEIPPLPQQRN